MPPRKSKYDFTAECGAGQMGQGKNVGWLKVLRVWLGYKPVKRDTGNAKLLQRTCGNMLCIIRRI